MSQKIQPNSDLKLYPKSSFWSKTDTFLLLFLVFGGGLVLADDLESFLVTVATGGVVFGLYFGINWLVKNKLYKDEIGMEVRLDKSKKILLVDDHKIKLSAIEKIHKNYLRRIGWRFAIQTKNKKTKFILSDARDILKDLKELLPEEVFVKSKNWFSK